MKTQTQTRARRRLWLPWLVVLLLFVGVQVAIADWDDPAPTTVDTGIVGIYSSLAVVNGNPAISYYDNPNSALKYARATDVNGTAWVSMTVDNSGEVGEYTSLAVVNGNPAISYYDNTYDHDTLKFARATDVNGTAWVSMTVDSSGDVGEYTSLAVVNGNPAISYYDVTNRVLKYARATDVNGTAWISMTVDANASSVNVGWYTSLAVVNGNPAISYYDVTAALKYARATDVNGTAWVSTTVDNSGVVGGYTSLAVVNGNPAISYYDFTNNVLKYARAADVNGAAWTYTTLAATMDLGRRGTDRSLQVVNGNPAISCLDDNNYSLVYLRADNPNPVTLTQVKTQRAPGWLAVAVVPVALVLGALVVLRCRRQKKK